MDKEQLSDTFIELIDWLKSEAVRERAVGDAMEVWSPEDNWATADAYLNVLEWLEKKGIK